MAFFNKKQEVLDLKLTPYGEELLARGRFKPEYYAFFDDDILYDASGSAGIKEVQNSAEPRIQEGTPNNRLQYIFDGVERRVGTQIREAWEDIHEDIGPSAAMIASTIANREAQGIDVESYFYIDRSLAIGTNFSFVEPLGSMELGSEYAPSWDIKALKGELTGAINYLTSSTSAGIYSNVRRVPQLDYDITYRVMVGDTDSMDIDGGLRNRMVSGVFNDGTFLYLSDDAPNLILSIEEENVPPETEYDIEVFSVETGPDGVGTTLVPLFFDKPPEKIVNNILLDESEIPQHNLQLDSTYAEYFFQVNADLEIAEEDICPLIGNLRSRGVFLGDIPYDCPDVVACELLDIYDTNVVVGDVEDCE